MLDRRVDGVVDFNDYRKTPSDAVANLNWQLGCWQGRIPRLAISIGLAFNGLSTAEIAAGGGDAMFQRMGAALVSHGFAAADIRLGWESNGGWYGWGRKGAAYATAFDRAARVLKATPGERFIIWYNPTAGMEMNEEQPTAEDGMALDEYANSWNSAGARTEPGLWKGNLNGWWGFDTLGAWPKASLPTAVPELGVGSRSDGHGACLATTATACDDPFFLSASLQQAFRVQARFIGYWDYDAGDYNSQVSSGERPGEAAVLIRTFGSANLRSIIASHVAPFVAQDAPVIRCIDGSGHSVCSSLAIQTGPSRWDILFWAGTAHRPATVSWSGNTAAASLYIPARGTRIARALGAARQVEISFHGGDIYVVAVQQQGL